LGAQASAKLAEDTQKKLHLEESGSRRSNVATDLSKKAGPPSLVELRSSGGAANNLPPGWEERKNEKGLVYYVDHNTRTTSWPAGEYHGSKMGLYQLLPDGAEKGDGQGPVYRQRHDGDNEHNYLYRVGEFWWVSTEAGKEIGFMKSKVVRTEDQLTPPLHGWQYSACGGKLESDPTLVCSRDVSDPCREVRVELHGGAKEKVSQCAGSYLPVKGKINRGRWVLQHADGSEKFLRVETDTSSWSLGPTIHESWICWIASASGGDCCPASAANKMSDGLQQKSWIYYDGKAWVEGDIRVTCITHT